eukprot:TRINITY_DN5633_c0_g1_i1.p1 TRINITY_DN5633_c0_g1~~TRINITY_DN5633_c0_g1_i1.p1  ORF type:complete len:433 (-),score=64.62 TRINITY_DN5633_c0_g1_i1:389-1639(-)
MAATDAAPMPSGAGRDREIPAHIAALRPGGRYRLTKFIGSGSFGEIFVGTNIQTGEEVAVKLENVKARHPQLLYEYKVYKVLAGGVGLPNVRWFGTEGQYNVMVMDLLGPSLEDLFNVCSRRFSLKAVLMLADQMVSRLEYIHSRNFIHRDIKPDNFVMGLAKKANWVNAIDFGLAKKYRDGRSGAHMPYRENRQLTGTVRYSSINSHLGIEQSRRDDLEALGYVLLYLLKGSLPWQGMQAATKKAKYDKISEKKMSTPVAQLCKGCPAEFATYINYTRSLRYEDKPDYAYLRRLFRDVFVRELYVYDYVFDWTLLTRKSSIGMAPVSTPARESTAAATIGTTPQRESVGRTERLQSSATAGPTATSTHDELAERRPSYGLVRRPTATAAPVPISAMSQLQIRRASGVLGEAHVTG